MRRNSMSDFKKSGYIVYDLHDESFNYDNIKRDIKLISNNQFQSIDDSNNQNITKIENSFEEIICDSPTSNANERLLIVLDGANIGYRYTDRNEFDVNGIIVAIDYLKKKFATHIRILEIKIFIPAKYLHNRNTYNSKILSSLRDEGIVSVVPSGSNNHDDVYIITYAKENNGFIISNDLFRDHIESIDNLSTRQAVEHWLKLYTISYTFVRTNNKKELMINPGSLLYDCINLNENDNPVFMSIDIDNDVFIHFENQTLLSNELKRSHPHIDSLTKSINICAKNKLMNELKHLLLARAYSLIDAERLIDAQSDIDYVLGYFDNCCFEAIKLKHQIKKLLPIQNHISKA